ncbi:hypothetical protein BV20DRAFT_976115 [Pilatotrama ljubarskyi]|nr:hypothetical protein BV20DRAFT_976115 [Pilatotrama ljubarskyi]
MSFSGRRLPSRPVSTPPSTQTPVGAREKPPATKSTRATASRLHPPSQEEAWTDAESVIPDLGSAIEFLQNKMLIPEGDHAVTPESLITGLLHLAYLRPAHELAQRGLIALAYVAKAVLVEDAQEAVSRAVLERAETQLTIRLDEHASHVEARMAALTRSVEQMKGEMETSVAELKGACESVQKTEEALAHACGKLEEARSSAGYPGEPAPSVPTLTLETAPVRVRRAATLADLLQRQVLVRGASLHDEAGERLQDDALLARARCALDAMAGEGLSPPGNGEIEQAKVLRHEDVVFTTTAPDMAKWLLKPAVAKPFARKMGLRAQVIERTYKLVAERVPVSFNPQDAATLRAVEQAHDLRAHSIARAEWIKPIERRFPGQRTAFVMLTITGVDQANRALKGLTLAGRKVLVRRDLEEPKRCARCQGYDGHFARECQAGTDVCANCAGTHPTSQCRAAGETSAYRCANCGVDGHAAWDRSCPTLRAKVRARAIRKADAGFRFFVTNAPETWVSDEDELGRAPPPPTVWSQVQHQFERADNRTQPLQQSRLDTFFDGPSHSSATNHRQ